MVNEVTLIGNLGADPEVRTTASGVTIANVRLATSRKTKRDGNWVDETEWHKVVMFNQPAEFVGQYARKGRLMYVKGRLSTRKWQDKDGNDKYTTEIVADQVKLLDKGTDSGGGKAREGYSQDTPDADIPF